LNINNNNLVIQVLNILVILKILVVKKSGFEKNVSSIFLFIVSSLISVNVFAAAGDLISSTATINYDIGGLPTSTSASTGFIEDRRINFIVNDENGGAAVPVISDMTNAVLQFTVTNLGNATQDFLLTAANTSPNPYGLPADNFDPLPVTIRVYVESGLQPGYQPAQDTAVFVDELTQNVSRIVYVVADIPNIVLTDVAAVALIAQVAEAGAVGVEGSAINADDNGRISPAGIFSNGSTNVVAGTPSTNPDTLGMDTVFNDPAGLAPEDISTDAGMQDIAGNGQHSDTAAYQASSPVVLTKSVTVIDTLGGSDPHPGATLRYQIDVGITGNTPVSNLIINDLIPADTTYTDASISLDGIAQTDTDDAPADYSRAIDILSKPVASIEVDLSQGSTVSLLPGETHVIIFEVIID
jgi:uncharacterized repeat protein (TIGR01451 family)